MTTYDDLLKLCPSPDDIYNGNSFKICDLDDYEVTGILSSDKIMVMYEDVYALSFLQSGSIRLISSTSILRHTSVAINHFLMENGCQVIHDGEWMVYFIFDGISLPYYKYMDITERGDRVNMRSTNQLEVCDEH